MSGLCRRKRAVGSSVESRLSKTKNRGAVVKVLPALHVKSCNMSGSDHRRDCDPVQRRAALLVSPRRQQCSAEKRSVRAGNPKSKTEPCQWEIVESDRNTCLLIAAPRPALNPFKNVIEQAGAVAAGEVSPSPLRRFKSGVAHSLRSGLSSQFKIPDRKLPTSASLICADYRP